MTVKRVAECNTDHQLLCATAVRMAWHCCGQRRKEQRRGRYDVSKLLKYDDHMGSDSQQSLKETNIDCVVYMKSKNWVDRRWDSRGQVGEYTLGLNYNYIL